MDRRDFLKRGTLTIGGGLLLGTTGLWWGRKNNQAAEDFEVRDIRPLMHTYVMVTVRDEDQERAMAALSESYRAMGETAAKLSRFETTSPISHLNRTGELRHPDPEVRAVLAKARQISEISGGSFDPTVLPVLDYYYALPKPITVGDVNPQAIDYRRAMVDYRQLIVDEAGVRFGRPGMAITLDGIAKGYVVDRGVETLKAHGVKAAIVDAGGDVRLYNRPGSNHTWTVGLVDPQRPDRYLTTLRLTNGAMATSGNYEIFFSADHRYFHIVNPHTGYSPTGYSGVTILAPENADADALGVASFSLGLPRIREMTSSMGADFLVVSWDGRKRYRSGGFPANGLDNCQVI